MVRLRLKLVVSWGEAESVMRQGMMKVPVWEGRPVTVPVGVQTRPAGVLGVKLSETLAGMALVPLRDER